MTANSHRLPTDLSEHIGSLRYYQMRHGDYVQRRPEHPAPDYYLGYGDKYIHRFHDEVRPNLSPEGKAWCDRAMVSLQVQIEERRAQDPVAFAHLEDQSPAFRRFAFGTHPKAYLESGLVLLPVQDDLRILNTPDLKDILSPEGLDQVTSTLNDMLLSATPKDLRTATANTMFELVRGMMAYPARHYV